MRQLLGILFLAAAPLFAAGAITFDGSSYYTCDKILFDNVADDASIMAFVSPSFDDTDAHDHFIVSNFTASIEGIGLRWAGGTSDFRSVSFDFTSGFNVVCDMDIAFSAGDLIGIYVSYRNNIQNCEALNFSTGLFDGGSAFSSYDLLNSSKDMAIGSDATPGSNLWEGDIHQIIILDGRAKNSNNNQLPGARKFRNYPMFTGTFGLNGSGGSTPADVLAVWNMGEGNIGATVTSIRDLSGAEHTCASTGTPIATSTTMQR